MIYKGEQRMKTLFKSIVLIASLSLVCNTVHGQGAQTSSNSMYGSGAGLSIASIIAEYQFPLNTYVTIDETIPHPAGVYLTVESIQYNYASYIDQDLRGITDKAAIIIDRDNVTIDLNNQILYCVQTDIVGLQICGIRIREGRKNITIKDGTIVGFPGTGICIDGKIGSNVTNVKIENVKVLSNKNGIIANYVDNANLSDITVRDSNGSSGDTIKGSNVTGIVGISFFNSESVTIKDSSSTRNINTGTSATSDVKGISLYKCIASTLKNCICNNNQATGATGAGTATGIYITETTDDGQSNEIVDCTCTNNISTSGIAYGIHLNLCDLVHVKNCTMNHNIAGTGKLSYGACLETANSITCEGNTAIRNSVGFYDNEALTFQTNLFIQNTAYHNVNNIDPNNPVIRDYWRQYSTPIDFTQSSVDQLETLASASNKSNISVVIEN
jgi:hypothetical protein